MNDSTNKSEAEQFLFALDEGATSFCFQTFDDGPNGRKKLARTLHGSLDTLYPELKALNEHGAGVFVAVNAIRDGARRKIENVSRIRAVFADFDPPKTKASPPTYVLDPHISVESSPGKTHVYWLCDELTPSEFERTQRGIIAALGSDRAVTDTPRVMRLPGFFHVKDPKTPHYVRMTHAEALPPYPVGKLRAAFGLNGATRPPPSFQALPSDDPITRALGERGLLLAEKRDEKGVWFIRCPWGSEHSAPQSAQDTSTIYYPPHTGGHVGAGFRCQHAHCADRRIADLKAFLWPKQTRQAPEREPTPLKRIADMTLDEAGAHRTWLLKKYNSTHGLVLIEGKSVVVYRRFDANRNSFVTMLVPRDQEAAQLANQFVPRIKCASDGKTPKSVEIKPLFGEWMMWSQRRTYHGMVFNPKSGLIAGDTALADGPDYNMYLGIQDQYKPIPGECDLILDHIYRILSDGNLAVYDYAVKWLASLFQRPGELGHTVLVFKSVQGSGKNIFFDMLVRAFGDHACMLTDQEELTGRFNDHLANSVLVVANEATWGGSKKAEGRLKSLITDDTLLAEKKYIAKYRVKNCIHLIILSNNDWVIPMGVDDRRFLTCIASGAKRGDFDYFSALRKQIDGSGANAFIDYLMRIDLTGFDPREIPTVTDESAEFRVDQKMATVGSIEQWWCDVLMQGECNVELLVTRERTMREVVAVIDAEAWVSESVRVPSGALHIAYEQWARVRSKKVVLTSRAVGQKLVALVPGRVGEKKMRDPASPHSSTRVRASDFPSLAYCRAHFEAYLGDTVTWPE